MRETCTSGSMRGSDGRGVACNGRPSLSTLLVALIPLIAAMPRGESLRSSVVKHSPWETAARTMTHPDGRCKNSPDYLTNP
jgi:hypothetical protein